MSVSLVKENLRELREFLFHKIRTLSVTNAENGQLVRAFASTIIHKRNLRMGFSLPSPAVSHPDMPFMAWVRNYQLSCIIWLYNIQHSTLTGTSDYYTATIHKDGIVLSKAAYKFPGDFFNDNLSYRISGNRFRGNYSFLNLETVEHSNTVHAPS